MEKYIMIWQHWSLLHSKIRELLHFILLPY